MHVVAISVALIMLVSILQDGFEAIILPRRVSRRFRLSRMFYTTGWQGWSAIARKMRPGNRREYYLSYFGPLSLIFMLIIWACGLVLAFGLLQWGVQSTLLSPEKVATFWTYIYMSGTTFVTLGYGDVVPLSGLGRALAIGEAGTGFGFLALIIGYVPVIYQAFSRREMNITLLDARAGSPSSATELLRRHFRDQNEEELVQYMRDWERWCAELLESHISYPVLTYYRSQHERQSWLGALTTVLDTCALLLVGFEGVNVSNVRFTFAVARHASVDLAQAYKMLPASTHDSTSRLSSAEFAQLRQSLAEVGLKFHSEEDAEQRLYDLRLIYEPFVKALSNRLLVTLPPWVVAGRTVDDWQTSAWDHFAQWSPTKIDEITHIIVDHKKKVPFQLKAEQSHLLEEDKEKAMLDGVPHKHLL